MAATPINPREIEYQAVNGKKFQRFTGDTLWVEASNV